MTIAGIAQLLHEHPKTSSSIFAKDALLRYNSRIVNPTVSLMTHRNNGNFPIDTRYIIAAQQDWQEAFAETTALFAEQGIDVPMQCSHLIHAEQSADSGIYMPIPCHAFFHWWFSRINQSEAIGLRNYDNDSSIRACFGTLKQRILEQRQEPSMGWRKWEEKMKKLPKEFPFELMTNRDILTLTLLGASVLTHPHITTKQRAENVFYARSEADRLGKASHITQKHGKEGKNIDKLLDWYNRTIEANSVSD